MNYIVIIDVIEQISGKAIRLSNGWYCFMYKQRHFVYIPLDNNMIRIVIPYIANSYDYNRGMIEEVVNETNREVKFVKATVLKNGSISLNYDHKISEVTSLKEIVRHIIQTLYFASEYLVQKIESKKIKKKSDALVTIDTKQT